MDQYIGRLLDGRYEILEVIGTGASYQFDDEILANGIIDIRQN